jgi:S-adenosylmethionine synthetase
MASYEMSDHQIDTLVKREEAYRVACEKAAANGTSVVPFFYTPAALRRRR